MKGTSMKHINSIVLRGMLAVCFFCGMLTCTEAAEPDASATALVSDETVVPAATEEEETTKMEKISETISAVPEQTGNIFLHWFNKLGSVIEHTSGNRFETKWNPQRSDDPSLSPEHYGFEKDPAKGT